MNGLFAAMVLEREPISFPELQTWLLAGILCNLAVIAALLLVLVLILARKKGGRPPDRPV